MIGERLLMQPADGPFELSGNLFSGAVSKAFLALDSAPVLADPLFADPGAVSPEGYRLRPGSPAQGRGVAWAHPAFPAAGKGVFARVPAVPAVDFFGTPLRAGGTDIGAVAPNGN